MTNDLIICKCICVEDPCRNIICSFLCVYSRCGSTCQRVCHGTARESICTDRCILEDYGLIQLKLFMHYMRDWWRCCVAENDILIILFPPFSLVASAFHDSASGVSNSHVSSQNPDHFDISEGRHSLVVWDSNFAMLQNSSRIDCFMSVMLKVM